MMLIHLLEEWFTKGHTRQSEPTVDLEAFDLDIATVAAKIFKRGLQRINTSDGKSIEISKEQSTLSLIPPLSLMKRVNFLSAFTELDKKNCYFIVDSEFAEHWSEWKELQEETGENSFYLVASEANKNLSILFEMIEKMPAQCTSIFAVGGGITLDMAGMVAGLLDLPVDYLATTLLSAVDASVGGKTGVNFEPSGKNQLGLFVSARSLTIVPEYFSSLPSTEIMCGLAEAAKHAWLFGRFEEERALLERIRNGLLISNDVASLIFSNYTSKTHVVMNDPFEKNIRKTLNLGHTVGHVLEGLASEGLIAKLPHGLAVALGIVTLLRLEFLKNPPKGFEEFLLSLCKLSGVTFPVPICAPLEEVLKAAERLLRGDKKNESDAQISFVIPPYGSLSSLGQVKGSDFLFHTSPSEALNRMMRFALFVPEF
jgi:3-dehydroquinate synthase